MPAYHPLRSLRNSESEYLIWSLDRARKNICETHDPETREISFSSEFLVIKVTMLNYLSVILSLVGLLGLPTAYGELVEELLALRNGINVAGLGIMGRRVAFQELRVAR